MKPDKITITNNEEQIKTFLNEVVIYQRRTLRAWAEKTHQSPAAKIGYIGQHLASLITGVKGTGTGARGNDLEDGTEVKSCNKIDQVDKCKECGERVLRQENTCPYCGSSKIQRKEDSKWLFTVRSEEELQQYLNLDRILLLLMDYPEFEDNNFNNVRIQTFEIYPKEDRMKVIRELLTNHYNNIYLPKLNNKQKTNPMNLHPDSFQFYKCNPIKTFECIIDNIDTEPTLRIFNLMSPDQERDNTIKSEPMPTILLKENEWDELLENSVFETEIKPSLKKDMGQEEFKRKNKKEKAELLPFLNENLKEKISLRDIKSITQSATYHRN